MGGLGHVRECVLNLSLGILLIMLAAALEVWHNPTMPFFEMVAAPAARPPRAGLVRRGVCEQRRLLRAHPRHALFFVLIVCGQLVTAAAFDHVGFGGVVRVPLTVPRAVAHVAAIAGAGMTVAERASVGGDASVGVAAAVAIATVGVGALMVLQANLSRRVAALLPSRLAAVWWSFAVSTLVAGAVCGVQAAFDSAGAAKVGAAETWAAAKVWYFLAAPLGVAYIASSILFIPQTGATLYFVCLSRGIAGQLVGSAIIDRTGALDSPRTPTTPLRGAGISVVILAAAVTQVPPAIWARLPFCRASDAADDSRVEVLGGARELEERGCIKRDPVVGVKKAVSRFSIQSARSGRGGRAAGSLRNEPREVRPQLAVLPLMVHDVVAHGHALAPEAHDEVHVELRVA